MGTVDKKLGMYPPKAENEVKLKKFLERLEKGELKPNDNRTF